MPIAQLKPAQSESPASPVRAAFDPRMAAPLWPARTLQERLQASANPSLDVERWSPRSSVALIMSTSIGLWGVILAVTSHLLHAVA